MELNQLSFLIRGAIFEVHKTLGPGLLESIYECALFHELNQMKLDVKRQVMVPVYYHDHLLPVSFKIDLVVNNQVIVEVKSVERLADIHKKQLLTYLKLAHLNLGILVNFNDTIITDRVSIFRIING